MKPRDSQSNDRQNHLYQSRLDQQLNLQHPLFRLAGQIEWAYFDKEFGALYTEDVGRPGMSTRLMFGLHYLKHTFNESDESVVERRVENPYWQYFCGYEFFQHEFPCHPTSMVKWRQRMKSGCIEKMLKEIISSAQRSGAIEMQDVNRVNDDTTVQEKAIAFPTDARLYQKARESVVREAQKANIDLRQSYKRVGKKALFKQGVYARSRQIRKSKKETRKLRNYLGRVLRDVERKHPNPTPKFKELLSNARRIHQQEKDDSPKLYSVHAPEVMVLPNVKTKSHPI
jgi:transposase, IS5 family